MNANALEREALGLPSNERAKLALELIQSLETLSDQEVAELWRSESRRRAHQIDNGEVILIPAEVVDARSAELLR
ncbi:MAG: addiction module antitoxin RelB [Nevskiaceae bacterium]|nr:MAG: addiction module antitoxin RelB [Nevskiaceae bacterium]TBR73534.1 MAG: addiction module antitoxin RelB [Nevskiaceae bacterium]